jgi:predicted TIM-barrel fold metal-dependent hydrolase
VLIDFHVHVGTSLQWKDWILNWFEKFQQDNIRDLMDRTSTPEGLLNLKKEAGLDYLVILAEIDFAGTVPNEFVAELAKKVPGALAFANINPTMEEDPAGTLEYLVRDLGCRGLKLLPTYHHFYLNDPKIYPIYAKAQELDIPVLIHTGSSTFPASRMKYGQPIFLDDVASDFPQLKIVMAHSGRGCWYQEAFFLARHHANIYMEVAGLPPKNLLKYFPDLEKIYQKVIFGSDWPSSKDIKEDLHGINQLPISDLAKEAILGDNAARVLGLI